MKLPVVLLPPRPTEGGKSLPLQPPQELLEELAREDEDVPDLDDEEMNVDGDKEAEKDGNISEKIEFPNLEKYIVYFLSLILLF